MLKTAIIGHGFVGNAIDKAFDKNTQKYIIDPKYNTNLQDLSNDIDVAFISVPTPMSDDGSIDASIVISSVEYIINNTNAIVCIKSTVTPDIIKFLSDKYESIVYNPEFLREVSAIDDFINPKFHIFGGHQKYVDKLKTFYTKNSTCNMNVPIYCVSAIEASFIKYGINTFLALKVLWFNQFYDAIKTFDQTLEYQKIIDGICLDERISSSHTTVPGFDGRRGYGGACFPKDTMAFLNFYPDFSLLKETILSNNQYRIQYNLDHREIEQKVKYDLYSR